MLHLLYILAFTTLAFLALGNLIRSLMTLGREVQKPYGPNFSSVKSPKTLHPELLDQSGNIVNEPLLVMRSVSMQDARERLDALYNASPNVGDDVASS